MIGKKLMIASSQTKPTETVANQTVIAQTRLVAEHRVLLHNVSWETFERLLTDIGDQSRINWYDEIILL